MLAGEGGSRGRCERVRPDAAWNRSRACRRRACVGLPPWRANGALQHQLGAVRLATDAGPLAQPCPAPQRGIVHHCTPSRHICTWLCLIPRHRKGILPFASCRAPAATAAATCQNSSCRCAHAHPRLLRAASWTMFRLVAYSDATTTARAVALCCVQLSRIESAAPGVDGELLMPPQREASVATGRGGPGAVQGRSMSITQNQKMLESIARRLEGAVPWVLGVLWILGVLGVLHGLYHLGSSTRRRRFASARLPAEAASASHSSTVGCPARWLRQCAISFRCTAREAHGFAARCAARRIVRCQRCAFISRPQPAGGAARKRKHGNMVAASCSGCERMGGFGCRTRSRSARGQSSCSMVLDGTRWYSMVLYAAARSR